MDYFCDCTVLITGASSGIGRAMALQLAPYASHIVLVARRLDRLEALKTEIAGLHLRVSVHPYGVDLADEKALGNFLASLEQSGLEIDFLINNAGLGDHGPFESGSWERIQQMLDVNITALTRLTHQLLPKMIRVGEGAILNVSSVASFLPVPHLSVYAASKAYVTSFSEALRAELRDSGITVTTVCPGPVPTEFGQKATRGSEQMDLKSPAFLNVGTEVVAAAALRAVAQDRAQVVPGCRMAALALLVSLLPIFILRFFLNAGARKFRQEPNS